MNLDLTLDGLKIPGMPEFTPSFGTKKADNVGLGTGEVNYNMLLPWNRQRPFTVAEISSTGAVQANATIALISGCTAITLGDGAFSGVEVKLINTTPEYVQLITGQETGWIMPHETIEVMWTGIDWYVLDGHKVGEILNVSFPIDKMPFGYLTLLGGLRPSRTAFYRLKEVFLGALADVAFTCTTATPSVFTKTAHGFVGGERLRLFNNEGGSLTGATLSQDYFVERIDANTFYLNTTEGGTARLVVTAQSGTHYYQVSAYGVGDGSTTMDLPDPRQSAFVGAGSGTTHNIASVDSYLRGQWKDDQIERHLHGTTSLGRNSLGVSGGNGRAANTETAIIGDAITNGTDPLRSGAVTRTKQLGTNYIIKY